mmetsp:Transcript_8123/g.25426  ORF Transcript_8123/g.25426 Transcript_8123/m.25426 type:complete len:144 (+) Transcript_8123:303-734(+)
MGSAASSFLSVQLANKDAERAARTTPEERLQQEIKKVEVQLTHAREPSTGCCGGGEVDETKVERLENRLMELTEIQAKRAAAKNFFDVTVPKNGKPGDVLEVIAPDGRVVRATVPPGLAEGAVFQCSLLPVAEAAPVGTTSDV